MVIIGVDNGLSGGLAAYYDGNIEAIPMPVINVKKAKGNKNEYDIPAIIDWISKWNDIRMVVIERAQAMPLQGVVSQFTIGKNFGMMLGILAGLKIPHQIIAPKAWQGKMFEGVSHEKGETKQASILVAQRLFPGSRFTGSEKSKKANDGMTDASLMAVFGARFLI